MSCLKIYAPEAYDIDQTETYDFSDAFEQESDASEIVPLKKLGRAGNLSLMEILARSVTDSERLKRAFWVIRSTYFPSARFCTRFLSSNY